MGVEVQRVHNRSVLRHLLNADVGEGAYALGDLDEPLWAKSEFWGGYQDEVLVGLLLFYRGFEIPSLTMHGHLDAVAAIMNTIRLEPEVFCLAPAVFHSLIGQHYTDDHLYELYRMMVIPEHFQPAQGMLAAGEQLCRLTEADASRLNALYAQAADPGETIMAFTPSQIELGVFYGVQDAQGELIAAAGTHVVSEHENIAAVGNVFTQPALRGRGLGKLTTSAVTQSLFDMHITRVVLNVKQKNAPAVRVYEQLGYRTHCEFIEGPALLR